MQTLEQGRSSPTIDDNTENQFAAQSSAEQLGHNAALITRFDTDAVPPGNFSPKEHRSPIHDHLTAVEEDEERIPAGSAPWSARVDLESQVPKTQHQTSPSANEKKNVTRRRRHNRSSVLMGATDKLKDDLEIWHSFFRPRKEHVMSYMKNVVIYLSVPLIGIAAILFYFKENPAKGGSSDENPGDQASASWLLLFSVRQVVTFSLALALQMLVVDLFCVGTRVMLRLLGPLVTLLLVQSKGWPFVVCWWAILDFALLYGRGRFAKHWGFWQETVGLFNEENPSGHVVDSVWNTRILTIGITVSVCVVLKRFIVGLYLGRQTFGEYHHVEM
jgi:hypothetical protein